MPSDAICFKFKIETNLNTVLEYKLVLKLLDFIFPSMSKKEE